MRRQPSQDAGQTFYKRIRGASRKRFGRREIGCVEAFGEAVVNRSKEGHRLSSTILIVPQPGKARGGAQFPGERGIPPRRVERSLDVMLGRGHAN